ncbi:MAG TPA: class I SAM-dependent methyltransferase [Puia sp.]|jgi:ubiquinone/menaquinone biosynthesis C-methylase UbiE|nr:class I SAM-dependent methyltransferase [Puia sp.]
MANPLNELNPTGRFSDRVGNYVRYRPSYPAELIPFLETELGLKKGQQVADIGSGTGIFTELLLLKGYHVTGVEPNEGMRQAAEQRLGGYDRFYSQNGRAEATGLEDQSVHLITVAQAFHWMEVDATRKEFLRILKPGGHMVLLWNLRLVHTAFLQAYEEFTRTYGQQYESANRINEAEMAAFFQPREMRVQVFPHVKLLDFEALKGLVLSASYMPLEGEARYEEMIGRLEELYAIHKENGLVKMEYETKVYYDK